LQPLPLAEPPSKTQVKAAMHELRELGESLVALSPAQLARFDLPDGLRGAINEAQRITAHGGRKRQIQYIGRLMRSIDPEPIRARFAELAGSSRAAKARQRTIERWRERLIDDDAALTEFVEAHLAVDTSRLRNLIRNARRERAADAPPHAQREIFRLVTAVLDTAGTRGTLSALDALGTPEAENGRE
jgi:ribosome-associated protein